ncbi:MAG: SH3 domain-containing protein [Gammaproteobacteria bacterium]|nr:SH3 domain-containing protein [Gammaproteobacteria bacterium]
MPRRSTTRLRLLALLLSLVPVLGLAAPRELLQLFVTEPFLELHTGPGRGYPVTQVVARGEAVDVLFRRTEWLKVRTERGVEGWAAERSLLSTVLADGSPFKFDRGDRQGFQSHRWEGGILTGDYAGATLVEGYLARSLTDNLKLELHAGQFLGNLSNGYVADLGLNHVFMPEWRFSPFVTLGTGVERTEPKATLVTPLNQNYQTAYAGAGARYYLTRRFFLRAEYRHHTVFTKSDANEVKQEWKIGFAFFY